MTSLEWSEIYRTGFFRVDRQHQEIFRLINQVVHSPLENRKRETVESVLRFFLNYVEEHFTEEERYMRASQFPDYPSHHAQHEAMKKETTALYRLFMEGQRDMGPGLGKFLTDLFVPHIVHSDVPFVAWVKARWDGLPAPS